MTKDIFIQITAWQEKTFPDATTLSKLTHLAGQDLDKKSEIAELRDAIYNKSKADVHEEFADCFFLLFGAAATYGMTYEDICNAISKKQSLNLKRKWNAPDANGVCNHVKQP